MNYSKPNVLFLMTDQLSASVLPLYGGAGIPTPHLDALARRGVTFDNMVSIRSVSHVSRLQ